MHVLGLVRRIAAERSAGDAGLAAVERAIGSSRVGPPAGGLAARQRDELLRMVAAGQADRALVLCREHVAQYPDDTVIVVLLEVLASSRTEHGETPTTERDDPSGGRVR